MFMTTIGSSAAHIKGFVSGIGLPVAGYLSFQSVVDPVTLSQSTIIERVFREGGFFAIVLILLYFYRRDTKWATEFWKDEAGKRDDMIRENTAAQTSVAAALSANTVVVHQAKRVMEEMLPMRRNDNGVRE